MGCEDLVSHLELRHGIKVDDEDSHSGLHVKTVYCLGNCALSPAALDRREARSAGWIAIGSTRSSRRRKAKRNERPRLRILRILRRSPSARILSQTQFATRRAAAASTSSLSAPDRAASFGSSRSSRSKRLPAASATARSQPGETAQLFEAGFLSGGAHPKALGRVDDIPYLAKQQRLIFARCGLTDPLSLDDYRRPWRPSRPGARVGAWPESDDRGGSGLRPARARRGRLSDRHQMADDRRRRGRSEVHRLQRRRGRQRHVRRPDVDGRRPLPSDRGHGDRRRLGRRDTRLRLYPLRISARLRDVSASDRAGASRRPARPQRARLRHTPSISRRDSAPAPISAAKRRRSCKVSRESAGRSASSRPCQRSQACSASRPSSTMC